MVIDIKQHIGQILYERDSLIIPDLGGFVSAYKPATIDHVQGMIHPPSKKLNFNKNLIINDGVLINCLQEALGVGVAEAKKATEDFVHRTIETLNNREIIVIPGVGRLYKDYENNLQFLQDNTNYNTAVYGLPALQFYPILRARTFGNIAPERIVQQPTVARSFSYRKAAAAMVPFMLVAIITIGAVMFYQRQVSNNGLADAQMLPVVENRINKKPGEHLSLIEGFKNQVLKSEPEKAVEPESDLKESNSIPEQYETESATLSPNMKECVIIIGAFSKKAGVERRVSEIVDLGYSVYQDKKGNLTRVGIQFAYQDKNEIREKLNVMRDSFDNRAWILNE
jgi:cell division septation protein DedD